MPNSPIYRRVAAIELSVVFALIMAQIWVLPGWSSIVIGAVILAMMVKSWVFRPIEMEMTALEYVGIQPQDFSQAKKMFVFALAGVALMFGLALMLCPGFYHRPDYWKKVFLQFRCYILWAFVQQLLLQGYFTNRLEAVLEKRWLVAAVAGLLFGLAHIPNPILMPVTAIFGGAGAWFFLKSRNLYLATIFHAFLGTAVKYLLTSNLLHHGMRVGPGFWN